MEKIDLQHRADTIPLFLSFCIEQYAHKNGISGDAAMTRLLKSGALHYLEDNYDIIHTQGPQWILEEIDLFLTNHPTK